MGAISLHDKAAIRALLRRSPELHVYSIGDLDEFFWPYTNWYTLREDTDRSPVALIYSGGGLPVLLAIDEDPSGPIVDLLRAIRPLLPRRIYAHLSGDLANVLREEYLIDSHGMHFKMALRDPARLAAVDTSGVVQLLPANLAEVEAFYRASYPGNWFDPRMLETGQYYGIRRDGALASVAGIHVYSPTERVAALGNVATEPRLRGQGLARAACARLTLALLETVDYVGLNVKADNAGAIAAYERLGFERIASYEECMLEA
jgi:ribosomal protein S18 acetylase RimI-like enzyme